MVEKVTTYFRHFCS